MCDTHGPEMVHIRHAESGGEALVPKGALPMYGPGWQEFEPPVPLAPSSLPLPERSTERIPEPPDPTPTAAPSARTRKKES